MNCIYTSDAPQPVGPYSQAIFAGDTLYCSGQIGLDPATGQLAVAQVAAQTHQVCRNLQAVLQAAGLSFAQVVKTTCFLADMQDFDAFNAVYAQYFVSKPARSCVAAKALPKNALVEIECIAVK